MSSPGLEEGRKMSFEVEIGLFPNLVLVSKAVLVLENSQDGISILTYFSQNSQKK